MNEKPKSIWRKPWKGLRGFFLCFILLATAIFVVVFGLLPAGNNSNIDLLTFSLIVSIGIATSIVLLPALFRWAFCRRNLRRILFGLVCLVTLIALFYAEENWRGKHAWGKYKREQEAKGEEFDLKSIVPPSVPDDQNFAMTPIWVEEISGTDGSRKSREMVWEQSGGAWPYELRSPDGNAS